MTVAGRRYGVLAARRQLKLCRCLVALTSRHRCDSAGRIVDVNVDQISGAGDVGLNALARSLVRTEQTGRMLVLRQRAMRGRGDAVEVYMEYIYVFLAR